MTEFGKSYPATGVWSKPADVETLESYEAKIHQYADKNYTYIPMPSDNVYYNVDQEWIREIHHDQYIYDDDLIRTVFQKLADYPFLLYGGQARKKFLIKDGELRGIISTRVDERWLQYNHPEKGWVTQLTGEEDLFPELDEIKEDNIFFGVEIDKEFPELAQEVFYEEYDERYAIITLADLNKRGARESMYSVFAELAQLLGEKIKEYYSDSTDLLDYAKPSTTGLWYKEKMRERELHISEFMTLSELQKALKGTEEDYLESCGFSSKSQVDKQLGGLVDLRNRVMHANRTLIHNRQDLNQTLERMTRAETIISDLGE